MLREGFLEEAAVHTERERELCDVSLSHAQAHAVQIHEGLVPTRADMWLCVLSAPDTRTSFWAWTLKVTAKALGRQGKLSRWKTRLTFRGCPVLP